MADSATPKGEWHPTWLRKRELKQALFEGVLHKTPFKKLVRMARESEVEREKIKAALQTILNTAWISNDTRVGAARTLDKIVASEQKWKRREALDRELEEQDRLLGLTKP